jgi:hypothetical protein
VEPILVTAKEAGLWTGRPVGTIWRWASERRITRHETPRGTRYDLRELPPAAETGPGTVPALPEGRRAA